MKYYNFHAMMRSYHDDSSEQKQAQPTQIKPRKKSIGERIRQYLRINIPEVDSNSLDEILRKLI